MVIAVLLAGIGSGLFALILSAVGGQAPLQLFITYSLSGLAGSSMLVVMVNAAEIRHATLRACGWSSDRP